MNMSLYPFEPIDDPLTDDQVPFMPRFVGAISEIAYSVGMDDAEYEAYLKNEPQPAFTKSDAANRADILSFGHLNPPTPDHDPDEPDSEDEPEWDRPIAHTQTQEETDWAVEELRKAGAQFPNGVPTAPQPRKEEKPLTMYWCAVLFNATPGDEYPVHVHVMPLSTEQYDELEHLADVAIPYHTEYAIYGLNCRVVNVPANIPAVIEISVLDQCKGDILEILMQPKPVPQSLNFRAKLI